MSETGIREHPDSGLRLITELGPLVVFFLANWKAGIFWATGLFMAATAIALAASYIRMRTVPVMPLVTGVFVLIFGGLTLWLQDETFIKLKPTIVNLCFASILAGGLAFKRPLLKIVFASVFALDDEGWRKLTIRWMIFFVVLAILNEIVWRSFSTDTWVSFKVFGIMPLTFVFSLAQLPLLKQHALEESPAE
ncbi:MAG: septation protein A [Rhodobiaceae bacterium]|nr:septation protein A [Rhodobiaceae bacterium]MCC0012480.1 septation protein A [Rhodobiaceae bacterium]MCC0019265.1 septation protein A [Rhodobiaceae bacterium]MCC0051981.1 septation protein A [Rhodobiaceae bacterium]MCC0061687.1 septation protein A [Rhodobiaceae bacterium]